MTSQGDFQWFSYGTILGTGYGTHQGILLLQMLGAFHPRSQVSYQQTSDGIYQVTFQGTGQETCWGSCEGTCQLTLQTEDLSGDQIRKKKPQLGSQEPP